MPAETFGEKDFYLEEFRGRTLCFAVPLADCERPGGFEALGVVVQELLGNGTRVILLLGLAETSGEAAASLRRVQRRLRSLVLSDETARRFPAPRGRPALTESFVDLTGPARDGSGARLDVVWEVLRARPLLVGVVETAALLHFARRLAGRLRVHKLVIVESAGGVATAQGGQLSFMDDSMLTAVLHEGGAEWAGLAARRATLEASQAALREGVRAVNLCTIEGLARELYTYEGSGTLLTLEDYCRIERLGIDDFEEVERLMERGQREGYLKLRSARETARILLNGYGATIGTHHLAGVCALETEPYEAEGAGEIVGLYTITRFKGEGVAARLVRRMLEDARQMGLRYVFACTTEGRAQAFFERMGFALVGPHAVPAAKWVEYDPQRRERLKIYRLDVEPATTHGVPAA